MYADHPVSLQLEACLGHSRTDTHQLLVPLARGKYQKGAGRRIPEGAQVAYQAAIACCFGWAESAPKQIGARVSGRVERPYPIGISAALRARPESGRVFVGMAQAARSGELLSGESGRIAYQRTKQAQECAETSLDHRRLLDAGYALVVS